MRAVSVGDASPKLNAWYCAAERKNGFAGGAPRGRSYFTRSSILFRQWRTKRRKAHAAAAGASRVSFHNIVLPAASGYTVNIFRRLPD